MVVTKPILTKSHADSICKELLYRINENMTNGVASATRSETDGETD